MLIIQFHWQFLREKASIEEMIKCSIEFALIQNPNPPLDLISQIANNENNFNMESNSEFFGSDGAVANSTLKRAADKILQSRR